MLISDVQLLLVLVYIFKFCTVCCTCRTVYVTKKESWNLNVITRKHHKRLTYFTFFFDQFDHVCYSPSIIDLVLTGLDRAFCPRPPRPVWEPVPRGLKKEKSQVLTIGRYHCCLKSQEANIKLSAEELQETTFLTRKALLITIKHQWAGKIFNIRITILIILLV